MSEENQHIRIALPFFSNFWLSAVVFLNHLLVFLQLREKREYWGIIYDSVTKQPLDPVRVNLVYADSGKSEGSCISDINGRYGFLARPGKFKILVQKTNYTFPSKIATGDQDGIYNHLYHGEFFELTEDSAVIAPNIPMDPVGADWNQSAKKRLAHKAFYSGWFMEKLITVIFWFGFIYVSLLAIQTNFTQVSVLAIVGAYFFVFILELLVPHLRLFGIVLDKKTSQPFLGISFKLTHPALPNVEFGSAVSREDGKYFLRANPGSYLLRIGDSQTGQIFGSVAVQIGREGIVNRTMLIDKS